MYQKFYNKTPGFELVWWENNQTFLVSGALDLSRFLPLRFLKFPENWKIRIRLQGRLVLEFSTNLSKDKRQTSSHGFPPPLSHSTHNSP